jgi:hypothetical protein
MYADKGNSMSENQELIAGQFAEQLDKHKFERLLKCFTILQAALKGRDLEVRTAVANSMRSAMSLAVQRIDQKVSDNIRRIIKDGEIITKTALFRFVEQLDDSMLSTLTLDIAKVCFLVNYERTKNALNWSNNASTIETTPITSSYLDQIIDEVNAESA